MIDSLKDYFCNHAFSYLNVRIEKYSFWVKQNIEMQNSELLIEMTNFINLKM